MQIPIAKCGCDCNICPTFKNNIKTKSARIAASAGWKKYLNISLSPEKLRACDGCSIPDGKRKTYYLNCKIRKCASLNKIDNCAYCSQYPCPELGCVHSIQKISSVIEFTTRFNRDISQGEFKKFVEPYCGIKHLDEIRGKINPAKFIDFIKHDSHIKFSPNIHMKDVRNKKILANIYTLLTSLCIESNISFARLKTLEVMREQIIKILWTMALFGKRENDHIELDAKTFMEQKIHGMLNTLTIYFEELKKYRIYCEIIHDENMHWLTPMGGLRKDGLFIRLTYKNEDLILMQKYVHQLYKKHKSKGLKHFNTADLSILFE